MIAGSAGSRRIVIAVAVAAGALLALGGCAAGQHAQTAEETPVVDGVAGNAGPIALRALTVAPPTNNSFPKGGEATLQLVIVNQSLQPDQLARVTTPAAGQVRFLANGSGLSATSSPGGSPAGAGGATTGGATAGTTGGTPGGTTTTPSGGTSTPTAGGTTPGTATATAGGTSPAAGRALSTINLPPGRAVSIGFSTDEPVIQLQQLTQQLFPAQTLPVTFEFAHSGSITLTVAVHLAPPPASTPTVNISPTAGG